MMELAYSPSLTDALIARLEEAARGVGLPLREIELLGQDPHIARAFVDSVQAGDHDAFLASVDWDALHARLAERGIENPAASLSPPTSDKAHA
jgi:hypothetical protein